MELLRNVLLILHFVGLAALLGGFFMTMSARPKIVPVAQLHGALTMLVTGLGLVAVHEMAPDELGPVDNTKVGVKLAILLVLTVLVVWGRRRESVPTWVWAAIGGLGLANVVIAVVW